MPVPQAGKMSTSKLIHYFSSHSRIFGIQASLVSDNITLNPTYEKTDESLIAFQTGIGSAAHTTMDTLHLTSHTRNALVDIITTLQDIDGGVIAELEVPDLLSKMHDILDSAVSKQVGNTVHILAYPLILLPGSIMNLDFTVSLPSQIQGCCSCK